MNAVLCSRCTARSKSTFVKLERTAERKHDQMHFCCCCCCVFFCFCMCVGAMHMVEIAQNECRAEEKKRAGGKCIPSNGRGTETATLRDRDRESLSISVSLRGTERGRKKEGERERTAWSYFLAQHCQQCTKTSFSLAMKATRSQRLAFFPLTGCEAIKEAFIGNCGRTMWN